MQFNYAALIFKVFSISSKDPWSTWFIDNLVIMFIKIKIELKEDQCISFFVEMCRYLKCSLERYYVTF